MASQTLTLLGSGGASIYLVVTIRKGQASPVPNTTARPGVTRELIGAVGARERDRHECAHGQRGFRGPPCRGKKKRHCYPDHHVAATIIVSRAVNEDYALAIYEPIAAFLERFGVPVPPIMPVMALHD